MFLLPLVLSLWVFRYPLPFNPLITFDCPKCLRICICAACRRKNSSFEVPQESSRKRKRHAEDKDTQKAPSTTDPDALSADVDDTPPAPQTPSTATVLGKRQRSFSNSVASDPPKASVSTHDADDELVMTPSLLSPLPEPLEEEAPQELEHNLGEYNSPEKRMSYMTEMTKALSEPPLTFRPPPQISRSTGTQESPDNPNYIMQKSVPYFTIAARKLQREKSYPMESRSESLRDSTLLKDSSAIEDGSPFQRARRTYRFPALDPSVTLPGQTWIGDVGMFGFDGEVGEGRESRVDETRALSLSLEGHEGDVLDAKDATAPIGVRMDQIELHPLQTTTPELFATDVDSVQSTDSAVEAADAPHGEPTASSPECRSNDDRPSSPEIPALDDVTHTGSLEVDTILDISRGSSDPGGKTMEGQKAGQDLVLKALAALQRNGLSVED